MTITSIAHTHMYIVNRQEEVKEPILEMTLGKNAAHKHYMIKYKIAMDTQCNSYVKHSSTIQEIE